MRGYTGQEYDYFILSRDEITERFWYIVERLRPFKPKKKRPSALLTAVYGDRVIVELDNNVHRRGRVLFNTPVRNFSDREICYPIYVQGRGVIWRPLSRLFPDNIATRQYFGLEGEGITAY